MFWEILATVFAGFLLAGLILPLRFFYKKPPKWLVPAAAGLGMMLFQIYSEYTWFATAQTKLPKDSVVVASVAKPSWFRPWSYLYPPTFWFVVLDKSSITQTQKTHTYQANLYFIERHVPIYPLTINIDCQEPKLDFNDEMRKQILATICPTNAPSP